MRAKDVMTTNVITVGPDASVQQVATLLSERGISGVPVVDAEGKVIGIVSEGDLLHRAETGTERRVEKRRAWWLDGIAAERDLAREYVKSHGRLVGEIMTREVISVDEDTDLAEVADLLETNKIKRVPVVRDGKPVGIISRANLVRALAATAPAATADSDDRTIRAALLGELQHTDWARTWASDIIVRDRIVHLWIADDEPEERRQALRVAAENTPGVKGVEEHIVPAPVVPAF
jgi:CBS domain-containing protein